jgi:protein NRD1
MILVEILGRVVQANLIMGESVMDFTIPTHAGDSSVVFVVGVGVEVDGMTATTIVSKIGIGMLHGQEIAVPEAHADLVGSPRPYSPPQRPAASRDVAQNQTSAKPPEVEKDEFGRDIRPSSATPPRAASVDAQSQPPMVQSVVPARTAAPENRVPVSDQLPSVAASTSTQKVEPRKPSSAPALQQPGLDHFDITTFDFTAPSSWEALGKMWHSTYGDTPSQEELMQFVMAGGVVAFTGQTNAVQSGRWQDPGLGAQSAGSGRGWQEGRGRGRGLMAGRGDTFGHGKYRDGGHWDEDAQHSDAIVLGEGGSQDSGRGEEQAYMDLAQMGRDDLLNTDPDDSQNVDSGRMQ